MLLCLHICVWYIMEMLDGREDIYCLRRLFTLDNSKITHMNKNTYQEPTAEVIQVMVEQTILEGSNRATLDPWDEEDID